MELKKRTLGRFFGMYAVKVCLVPVLIVLVFAAFFALAVSSGGLRLANYEEMRISEAAPVIEQADLAEPGMIPDTVEYVILAKDRTTVIDRGNMSDKHMGQMRNYVEQGIQPMGLGNPVFRIIESGQSLCVIRYRITVSFSNPLLRSLIPYPEITSLFIGAIAFAGAVFVLNRRTTARLKRELNKLLKATERIAEQNLDFEIESNRITELQRISQSLERMRDALKQSIHEQIQSEQSKLRQIGALAHDLKIPMTVIRGNTELLLLTGLDGRQKDFADDIHASVLKVEHYTRSLVEVSTHTLKERPAISEASADAFLSGIETDFRAYIKNDPVRFELHNGLGADSVLMLDDQLMHRALLNILTNAVEHTRHVQLIILNVTVNEDREWVFDIQDDGGGFSAEALEQATDLFYTQNKARSGDGHYGIGLNFADQVARLHEGRLLIRNTERGGQVQMVIPRRISI